MTTAWRSRPEAVGALRDWDDEVVVYGAFDATCHLLSGLPLRLYDALTAHAPQPVATPDLVSRALAEDPTLSAAHVHLALDQLAALGLAEATARP